MVRVGGMNYACTPEHELGNRISEMRLNNGELIEANKHYKVSGWASVGPEAAGKPVWDVVTEYLKDRKTLRFETINRPKLIAGIAIKSEILS